MTLPSAGLLRRLGAVLYDSLLLVAVLFGAGALFLAVTVPFTDLESSIGSQHPLYHVFQVYLLLVVYGYFAHFWRRGYTPGMRTWKLRVVRTDGHSITALDALIRVLVAGLSFGAVGLGYAWALINRDGLTWQDLASKTRVILDPELVTAKNK